MLKGPRGTHVLVTMTREGKDKPMTFDLVRDEIPRPSVDLAFEIKPECRVHARYEFSGDDGARGRGCAGQVPAGRAAEGAGDRSAGKPRAAC